MKITYPLVLVRFPLVVRQSLPATAAPDIEALTARLQDLIVLKGVGLMGLGLRLLLSILGLWRLLQLLLHCGVVILVSL